MLPVRDVCSRNSRRDFPSSASDTLTRTIAVPAIISTSPTLSVALMPGNPGMGKTSARRWKCVAAVASPWNASPVVAARTPAAPASSSAAVDDTGMKPFAAIASKFAATPAATTTNPLIRRAFTTHRPRVTLKQAIHAARTAALGRCSIEDAGGSATTRTHATTRSASPRMRTLSRRPIRRPTPTRSARPRAIAAVRFTPSQLHAHRSSSCRPLA
jgi:hypothetical protein